MVHDIVWSFISVMQNVFACKCVNHVQYTKVCMPHLRLFYFIFDFLPKIYKFRLKYDDRASKSQLVILLGGDGYKHTGMFLKSIKKTF